MVDVIGLSASALLVFAVGTTLFLLWAASIADVFRRHDLSLVKKAAWVALIILTAHIGVAFYFAMRPIPPPYGKGVKHTIDRSSNLVKELERLHTAHAGGGMTDGAYLAAKRDLLGVTV